MTKILGLDIGTNSIGWAVVEKHMNEFTLIDKGVRIFQEGVKIEKGIENSKAAERTSYRSARRLKFRRKLRKIKTLKALSDHGFCPSLSLEELDKWRYDKKYPQNKEFTDWWRTNDAENKTPYYYRSLSVTKKLDLSKEENRFIIGRALYHIAQRRGFLSNRLEGTKESEGAVQSNIEAISKAKGVKTLGQYFYEKYLQGDKIRDQYTHREDHYLQEFNKICEIQGLNNELSRKLYDAIFYQRPLKSQKGLIGRCVFEPKKQRCAVSHPLFEEYRMLCFVNNIKIKTPDDEKMRFLNKQERKKAIERFYLKKDFFNFEDIAKQLAPKKQYKYFKDRSINPEDFLFNYRMDTSISGNPLSAKLKHLFGEDFLNLRIEYTRNKDGKISYLDVHDLWHVLATFKDEVNIKHWAKEKLGLEDEKAVEFAKIRPKSDYASLSLNAIKKILPFLRNGMIYSHAVVLANMEGSVPKTIWNNAEKQAEIITAVQDLINNQNEEKAITEVVNGLIKETRDNGECWSEEAVSYYLRDLIHGLENYYGKKRYASLPESERATIENNALQLFRNQMLKNLGRGEFLKVSTIDERVKGFLIKKYSLDKKSIGTIYHPSAIETYPQATTSEDGKKYLGSPLISSVRNPMAMRALHQLRKVINELIREDIIDDNTRINIEMSRGLLNANERKALQNWQRDRETQRKQFAEKIAEHYNAQGVTTTPNDDDILKYQLWEEQQHKCVYTGDEIALNEFLGSNPVYDIEHTIPRSLSYDNSQENKTLCQNRFNRSIKKNQMPFELSNHEEITLRVDALWKNRIEELEKQIQGAAKQSKVAPDKETKDRAIQRRHQLLYEKRYWQGKYMRFFMKDVPQGFKNSQIVDTGIITKYARLYLKSLFGNVNTVKGNTVAEFRRAWGLQPAYAKKERINHVHHCMDAVVIACMTKENYEKLANYYYNVEDSFVRDASIAYKFDKPWPSFTEDIKDLENQVLVSHHTPDVFPKQTKKKLRKQGRAVKDVKGNPIYQQGDTVRGSLHKETFYGAIEREIKNKNGEVEKQIKYVVRKPLDQLEDTNIKNIVDDRIREIVSKGREKEKELKKEIEKQKKRLSKAEEHEESVIKEEIIALQNAINELYVLPTKKGGLVPIKKVRVFTPDVTTPILLKKHRDQSRKQPKEHKLHYHVKNDGNYLMAIYEGKDDRGKINRDFHLLSNLEAAECHKLSVNRELKPQGLANINNLIPAKKNKKNLGLPLKSIIKIGTLIIFWEKNPEEVFELNASELNRRLYKITGLSVQRVLSSNGKVNEYATIVMRFHQEARPAKDLATEDGKFREGEAYKAVRKVNHNQFNALVEGYDFVISYLGQIKIL